jgi:hypothetical protein
LGEKLNLDSSAAVSVVILWSDFEAEQQLWAFSS